MATKAVPAPKSVPTEGRALWRAIAKQWADDGLVPDARERQTLADACAELAMLGTLEAALAEQVGEGRLIVKGSMGQPVVNALVGECRRSRQAIAALLRHLGLEDPSEGKGMQGRPLTVSEAGRRGGLARRSGAR
ncbi:P27 family phage terminase small subunit [Humibacillus xanthopallidus]|uniref:Phage terminase small subunit n=1 Tax=Humibacillus xanthopallidus TaxID=412689 RepID=A0A543HWC5_9MICO|nr:P27 family phage terminase small subunit [Humibacillus xanthopallidus]TQM62592.1 hypothetical protein FBY41_2628 [Humibacillus xanthopallidus]